PFRTATEQVNRLFDGTHLLLVHLDLSRWRGEVRGGYEGQPGPLLDPPTLRAIGGFETFLGRQPRVGGVLGPYAQLTTVSFLRDARDPQRMSIPDRPDAVATAMHW